MRKIKGINPEEEIVVRREWVEGLIRMAEFVKVKEGELPILLGYISSAETVIKAGELEK